MAGDARAAAISLIENYYAAFNTGDMPAFAALLADDVVHDINQGARQTGKAEFAAFMQRMNGAYREQLTDFSILANEAGTRASAEFVVHGQYLKTDAGLPPARGQKYLLPAGAFFEIRAGKVARISNYYNLQDWIAQIAQS